MRAEYSSISKAVRTLQRLRPTEDEFTHFKGRLSHFISEVDKVRKTSTSGALEEVEKGLIKDFLKETFYGNHPLQNVNYEGQVGADLTIRSSQNNTLVLFEVKSGTNAEMVTQEQLLSKAFLECVVYYGFEKDQRKNDHIKHVVITNSREWFVFEAAEFLEATWNMPSVRDAFRQWRKGHLDSSSTSHLYARLKELLTGMDTVLSGTYCDLWSYKKYLSRTDEEATKELLKLWRFLHPANLLKDGVGNDSNALNKNFYLELLYILGLREVKDKGRKLIQRLPANERHAGALIEHTMARLDKDGALDNVKDLEGYGATKEEQLFNVGMELCITWLNRVLFLKLLEAQLLRFHGGDRRYAFLSPDLLKEFDQFHALFFDVMAVERDQRDAEVKEQYAHIPYLNSSLFEPTLLEKQALQISGLKNTLKLHYYARTILVEDSMKGVQPTAQEYLLRFLQAYDFGSEPGEGPKANNRPLITASVLGLIFEKINGYRDGSFYTPGYITMYMCRETIRRAVLQRFNEGREQPLGSWAALANYAQAQFDPEVIAADEAKVDGLRICDPAVGSGHFLVSALNELIAIKSELGLLTDTEGKRIPNWQVEVVNDELVVTNRDNGDAFQYTAPAEGKPLASDTQRVQSALFEQKRRLIENGLFGVDINANSVKICRLRLWIELLKNAYYTEANGTRELRTLPNIDINIKHGNSVLMRYGLKENISAVLGRSGYTVEQYQGFVQDYQEARDRDQRRGFQQLIEKIEEGFTKNIESGDPNQLELGQLAEKYLKLTGGLLKDGYKDEQAKAKAEAERTKLQDKMAKLQAAIEQEKAGLNHKLAFDWRYRFPQVLDANTGDLQGFDVIIGNPPYIRQEAIKAYKNHLRTFHAFDSTADLFVYFMELGHKLLAPGGHFCYIVANKWIKAGYGEKVRRYLGEHTLLHLVDFGDLPVFEEATTYPCILLTRQGPAPKEHTVLTLAMPELHSEDLQAFVRTHSSSIQQTALVRNEYRIVSSNENDLLERIHSMGMPLGIYLKGEVYYGIKTGLNAAFIVDSETREVLLKEDPKSSDLLRPHLAGKQVKRYTLPIANEYLILIKKGWTKELLGATLPEGEAFKAMSELYPAIFRWLSTLTERAKQRDDQGDYWWELRACDYYAAFERPKIMWAEIAERGQFAFDTSGLFADTTVFITPHADPWLLAYFNSKLFTWQFARISSKIRGGFFRWKRAYIEQIPVIEPDNDIKAELESLVTRRLAGDATLEAAIDRVVYGLYGLTEEEIAIVEGSSNK